MACLYWIRKPEHTDIFSEGYVGVTKHTAEERYREHLVKAKGSQKNTKVARAIKKYGSVLIVETIVISDIDYVIDLENKLRPQKNIGWNIHVGGLYQNKDVFVPEERRKKISAALKGRPADPAHIAYMNECRKKKGVSEESRRKMSLAQRGRKVTGQALVNIQNGAKKKVLAGNMNIQTPEQRERSAKTMKALHPLDLGHTNLDSLKRIFEILPMIDEGLSNFVISQRLGINRRSFGKVRKMHIEGHDFYNDQRLLEWLEQQ